MTAKSVFGSGRGRRTLDRVAGFSTLIGSRTTVAGELLGADNCVVNGTVKGNCTLDGVLVLGEGGCWVGNIDARDAIISGEVRGDIVVRGKLELTPTARVNGRISSPAVAMAEGAIHQGEIRMASDAGVVHFRERREPDG